MNPITYISLNERVRLREPYISKYRAKYRGTRESYVDNLEAGSFFRDVNNIQLELEKIELLLKDKLKYFGTILEKDENSNMNLFSPQFEIDQVAVYDEQKLVELDPVSLSSISSIGSKLYNLTLKVSRLETENTSG
jgi:hypothetical protein